MVKLPNAAAIIGHNRTMKYINKTLVFVLYFILDLTQSSNLYNLTLGWNTNHICCFTPHHRKKILRLINTTHLLQKDIEKTAPKSRNISNKDTSNQK